MRAPCLAGHRGQEPAAELSRRVQNEPKRSTPELGSPTGSRACRVDKDRDGRWAGGVASVRAVKLRVVCVMAVLFAGLAMAGGATAAQEAVSSEEIAVRDQLIAAQENLLNAYRCRFSTDTHLVPGGCGDPDTVSPGAAPESPTQHDIDTRDRLIQSQEALLNAYRCRFDIDTHIVPGGCGDPDTAPTPQPANPENLGPVAPSGEAWAEYLSIREFARACGYVEGEGQCRNHPEDTNEVIRRLSELYDCEWSYRWGGCDGYGGGRMWQLEDELFCQDGWIFWSWISGGNARGYCFHPDHPTYGIDARR